jgi:putative transposase
VDAEGYVAFLEDIVQEVRGPIIVLQDQARAHHGEALAELVYENPQLVIEEFPPYAPELNPTEFLWKHLKAEELANFAPRNLDHLTQTLHEQLVHIAHDQHRLCSFFASSGLTW